ncbi:MAG: DUF58 domain-containing protein [Clostridiales bacterium]|nr:DUF58 domain-containing protein [Clostridiales bacterium]
MWKSRIIWLIWLVGVLLLYLFGNNGGTLIVLLMSFILPILLIVGAEISARYVTAELTMQRPVSKGCLSTGILKVENNGILPLQKAKFRVICTNRLIGEQTTDTVSISCAPRRNRETMVKLGSKYCGAIDIEFSSAKVEDAFGIISRRVKGTEPKHIIVFPLCFDTEIILIEDLSLVVDSEEYSMTRPGSDPSETFAVREYVPGDSIKSIHWKLSQKTDRLMVREFGLPIVNRILVLMETSIIPGVALPSADIIDIMTETFFSISRELVRQGIPHALGWKNTVSGLYEESSIQAAEDIAGVIEHFLSNTVGTGNTTVASCFLQSCPQCSYAHVIVITPYIEPDITALYNGNRITVLLADGLPENDGMKADGIYVLSFTKENYKRDLSKLEL